jgi:hypothetical protein
MRVVLGAVTVLPDISHMLERQREAASSRMQDETDGDRTSAPIGIEDEAVHLPHGPFRQPWCMTASSTIDPTKFYARATAPQDDAIEIETTVPPQVLADIQQLVDDGDFPEYRTPDDFYRDALVHELHAIMGQVDDPRLRGNVERLLRRIASEEESLRAG